MTNGSIPVGPAAQGAQRLVGSGICPTGDPCVLTGQYDRYRTSTNQNETTLAAFDSTAYVPAVCAVTNGSQSQSCGAVPGGAIASGILVYSACP